ncbi:hypothetical protein N7509_007685 [Penicillium cosmopolitanum]|uniref:Uncharacterized protein n=1 Tax=Penicillium cosmopolitanum TaxID=1131564 RepID=A0A9X0B8L1_9EURO|nr:uncharacterized protein N7509_007685 [Penicillium cosmopolitanum]KAJ5392195.1 hypothetical protein N7509_007685 [Penicillium cosmopolitanum]
MTGSEQHFPYLGSPLVIPSIGLTICSAKRAAATRKAQTFSSPIPTSHPLVQLPLDIILLIADQICPVKDHITSDVVDFQNIISASGWLLSEGFWRQRMDEEIFFELEDIPKAKACIDWQALQLLLMHLSVRKLGRDGLELRRRLFETSRELVSLYVKRKAEEEEA